MFKNLFIICVKHLLEGVGAHDYVIEAGKSQDLQGEEASWRPRRFKIAGVIQRTVGSRPQEELIFQFKFEGKKKDNVPVHRQLG